MHPAGLRLCWKTRGMPGSSFCPSQMRRPSAAAFRLSPANPTARGQALPHLRMQDRPGWSRGARPAHTSPTSSPAVAGPYRIMT